MKPFWDYRKRDGRHQMVLLEHHGEDADVVAVLEFHGLEGFVFELPDVGERIEIPRDMFDNIRRRVLVAEGEELREGGARYEGHERWIVPGHGGTCTRTEALRWIRKDREKAAE